MRLNSLGFFLCGTFLAAVPPAPGEVSPDSTPGGIIQLRRALDADRDSDDIAARILALHEEARGGRDNLLAVNNLVREGQWDFDGQQFDYRQVLTSRGDCRIDRFREAQGWRFHHVTVIGASGAWEQNRLPEYRNPEDLRATSATALQLAGEWLGPLLFYREKGHRFWYRGTSRIGDRPAYHLVGKLAYGVDIAVDIDQENFLLLNMTMPDYTDGQLRKVNRLPTGMRRLAGVWWETGFDYRMDGKLLHRLSFQHLEVNSPLAEDFFVRPADRPQW